MYFLSGEPMHFCSGVDTGANMRRRDVLGFLGGAAAAWPFAAHAQQSSIPVIGFLNTGSKQAYTRLLQAFKAGLKETGFV
jgi:putative ABC transport system substrate-binding protein